MNEPTLTDTEEVGETLTHAILAHYGYTPDDIAEAEAVHPGLLCGDECWTEDHLSVHGPVHPELHATAAIVMDVVVPFVAARIAEAVDRERAASLRPWEADLLIEHAVDRERAAWVAKVEVLLLDWRGLPVWGPNTQGLMILDDVDSESLMADLRALLAADDTEAQA